MGRRMDYVDMARGVAIILVMTGHSILFPACGAIHIPTFFVLAGYVVTAESLSRGSLSGLLKKRVGRLLYPYVFYSLALLLIRLAKDIVSGSLSASETLKDIAGILYSSTYIFNREENNFLCFRVGNEGLWFLTAMAAASAVFYVLYFRYLKGKLNYARIAAAAALLIVVSRALNFLPFYLPWGFDIALLGTVFMLFGLVLRALNVFESRKQTVILAGAGAVLFALCHIINGQANMAIHLYGRNMLVFMASGCFASTALIGISRLLEGVRPLRRALSFVGQNTLFILAFHTMIFGVLNKVFAAVGIAFAGLWILRLVLTLFTCLAAQLVLEKIFHIPRKFL